MHTSVCFSSKSTDGGVSLTGNQRTSALSRYSLSPKYMNRTCPNRVIAISIEQNAVRDFYSSHFLLASYNTSLPPLSARCGDLENG
ncbi:hypothetical protein BV898_13599 [Hypsibius exemplaris]|uniref:Uncharacterized protein n=1 Tax=Hypsibius exemplaris TaxID=2072580 RepID=A0A1W0WAC1_HYPEX|nr:hypothetical protein BV898_13599 [Hypsibius exemplaris]